MKLISILDTEANRAVAYGGENSLTCFLEPAIKEATFQDLIDYTLQNHANDKWLENEVRSYLKQNNGSTIFLDIDCLNGEGEIVKRNARLEEKAAPYFDTRENEGKVYECIEMIVKLASAVG